MNHSSFFSGFSQSTPESIDSSPATSVSVVPALVPSQEQVVSPSCVGIR